MNEHVIIYSNPRSVQKEESVFLEEILKHYPTAKLISQTSKIPQGIIDNHLIDIQSITKRIKADTFLTQKNRNHILKELSALPHFIKIATSHYYLTIDVTIHTNDQTKYIEFHEKQHRRLSNKRKYSKIFTEDNTSIEVPRSIQRFLRDIWRVQYMDNYSIVWWDWFEKHKNMISQVLANDNMEYSLPNKFSFTKLLGKTL